MNTYNLTIPAAGSWKSFKVSGRSLQVIEMNPYSSQDQFPKIAFQDKSNVLPLRRQPSVYGLDHQFSKIWIQGTDESAGEKIFLISYQDCRDTNLNFNSGQSKQYIIGQTFSKGATDNVQQFTDLQLMDADGNYPSRVYIFVAGGATAGINYSYKTDPAQGVAAAPAWDNDAANNPGEQAPLELTGESTIKHFRFRATKATETPTLFVTPLY